MPDTSLDLNDFIRDIPDFPKEGIVFKDITPLLLNPEAFGEAIKRFADHYRDQDIHVIAAAAINPMPTVAEPNEDSKIRH